MECITGEDDVIGGTSFISDSGFYVIDGDIAAHEDAQDLEGEAVVQEPSKEL